MSYYLKVLKDNPIGFWTLDETSGTSALDSSPCGNSGTYTGGLVSNLMPLVPGGKHGTKITNTKSLSFPVTNGYYGSNIGGGVMNKFSKDNDFSLEIWFYPKFTIAPVPPTAHTIPLLADTNSESGIYYKNNGHVIFKVGGQEVYHAIENVDKVHHVVCSYTGNSLQIYHDGVIVANKSLDTPIVLTNDTTSLSIGPTNGINYMIVDAPAIYRYALTNDQVYSHFAFAKTPSAIQIANIYGSTLFSLTDQNIKKSFSFSYPFDKSWENFVSEETSFNKSEQSLSVIKTNSAVSKSLEFTDYITIPEGLGLNYSKIEWSATKGVSVSTSSDGTTYLACENGKSIPQYKNGEFDDGVLYIKVYLSTEDASKEIPKISYLNISFYQNQDIYADNSGIKITPKLKEYFLGNKNYSVLSRDIRNGLRCQSGGWFSATSDLDVTAIELFYTPLSSNDGGLIDGLASYKWAGGNITSTNIDKIYVNGVDTTDTTFSSVFLIGETYHILIKLSTPDSGEIKFNYSSGGQSDAAYKNIILHYGDIPDYLAYSNYGFYTERNPVVASAYTSVVITEAGYEAYNNDWVVLESQ